MKIAGLSLLPRRNLLVRPRAMGHRLNKPRAIAEVVTQNRFELIQLFNFGTSHAGDSSKTPNAASKDVTFGVSVGRAIAGCLYIPTR